MSNQANQKRIQHIYQMLFEMATGNFMYRIVISEYDDEIDKLSRILNQIAEKMLETINQAGYIIPAYTYQSLVQSTVIITGQFNIKSFSSNVPELLEYQPENLLDIPFSAIIGKNSQDVLKQIEINIQQDKMYFETHQLSFKTIKGLLIPSFCTISKLLYSDKIVINVVTTILNDYIYYTNETSVVPRPETAKVVQQIHNYILNHLDEPLPTLKELSKMFSSNQFALKVGFRYFFNTSIYHFYNEQRLKKAHLLLQQSQHSVKAIGIMSGFNDYPTFYKAFKKRFGYSPSELLRETKTNEDL